MTDEQRRPHVIERSIESVLFSARWIMAPFYLGLAASLALLLVAFFRELIHEAPTLILGDGSAEDAILLALSLVDLSLAGNLLLIVMFSGYESFVSKMDTGNHLDRPDWMGKVDFSGLKMKLIASIVAISAISLLKTFMQLDEKPIAQSDLMMRIAIHLAFVVSGVLLAVMDWFASAGEKDGTGGH